MSEMDRAKKLELRNQMRDHLRVIQVRLSHMLELWTSNDLEGDFLSEAEYPFDMSLDDQLSRVQHAIETIDKVNDFIGLEPITLTVSPQQYAALLEELERAPRDLPKLRALMQHDAFRE